MENNDAIKNGQLWLSGNEKMESSGISVEEPVGYLYNKNARITITVFKEYNWFQRLMIKLFFGFEYVGDEYKYKF